MVETIWIAFEDDDGETTSGYFEKLSETNNAIKLKTSKNILVIPWARVRKIKEPFIIQDKKEANKK